VPENTFMASASDNLLWYAMRDGRVRGPFTADYITRYLLLGRIRFNDRISQDQLKWYPVTDFPELLPEELSGLSSWDDYQQLVVARIRVDERIATRRRQQVPVETLQQERRTLPDRRRVDGDAGFFRDHLMDRMSNSSGRMVNRESPVLRLFLLATLLATLVVAYFSISAA
jgi:hypothetical protein